LAQAIEQETKGWLMAKSLRDPAMRELLDNARPGWTWEPMLVEVRGERVRVYTGLKMRSRLVVGLGPRRVVRVAQLVQQALVPKAEVDQGRRRLLQFGGVAGAALLLGGLKLPGVSANPAQGTTTNSPTNFTFADANKALALVLSSETLRKLRESSAREGLHLKPVMGHMRLLANEQGHPVYGGDKHSVLYLGEKDGHRGVQVVLGFEESNDPRNFSYIVGYVDIAAQEVVRMAWVDVRAEDDQNGIVQFRDAQGQVHTYSVTDGRAIESDATALGHTGKSGGKLFAPLAQTCPGTWLCFIAEQVACITFCFAVAGATGGVGGIPCGIICGAGFTWLCSYAC
jgi:hypothetical protein